MKQEQFMDALNLLEDDIIQAAYESRKNQKKNNTNRLLKIMVSAACLCILAVITLIDVTHDKNSLPILTLPNFNGEALGFEGWFLYDISELNSGNPWNKDMKLKTLPVFKNKTYNENGLFWGLDEEAMFERLEKAAKSLDTNITEIKYEYANDVYENVRNDYAYAIYGVTDKAEIRAFANGSISFVFNGDIGESLPPKYAEEGEVSLEKAEMLLDCLIERFSAVVDFKDPCMVLSGSYNVYAEYKRNYIVYDASGNYVKDILNYNLKHAEFYIRNNVLHSLWVTDLFECIEKIGDYPIITADEAKELLTVGCYITSSPYDFAGEEYIADVELVYRDKSSEILAPYYLFYVELPEAPINKGMKNYASYYVPAVKSDYIKTMP